MEIKAVSLRDGRVPPDAAKPRPARGGKETTAAGKDLPPSVTDARTRLHLAVESIDRYLREAGTQLSFSIDEVTGRTVVSIRDPATGKLIRQVPSEDALRIARHLHARGATLVRELA